MIDRKAADAEAEVPEPAGYILADLEKARAALELAEQKFANYTGNNPGKYQADRKQAQARVRVIEQHLKAVGIIPLSPHEELMRRLDAAFPNARSKQVVEFEGKRYVRRFAPASVSRSGKTVAEWDRWWEPAKA